MTKNCKPFLRPVSVLYTIIIRKNDKQWTGTILICYLFASRGDKIVYSIIALVASSFSRVRNRSKERFIIFCCASSKPKQYLNSLLLVLGGTKHSIRRSYPLQNLSPAKNSRVERNARRMAVILFRRLAKVTTYLMLERK